MSLIRINAYKCTFMCCYLHLLINYENVYKNIESTLESASHYSVFSWNCMSELTKLFEVAFEIIYLTLIYPLLFFETSTAVFGLVQCSKLEVTMDCTICMKSLCRLWIFFFFFFGYGKPSMYWCLFPVHAW